MTGLSAMSHEVYGLDLRSQINVVPLRAERSCFVIRSSRTRLAYRQNLLRMRCVNGTVCIPQCTP